MQFTIVDHPPPPPPLEGFLWMMLFLLPWVAVPLVRWLMRGARDIHDVLSLKASPPWTRARSVRELMAWACVAAAFMGPLLLLVAYGVSSIRRSLVWEPELVPELWSVETLSCGIVLLLGCAVVPLSRWLGQGPLLGRITALRRFTDRLGWGAVAVVFVGPCLFAALFMCTVWTEPAPSCEMIIIGDEWVNRPPAFWSMERLLPGSLAMALLVGAVSLVHAWWLRSTSSREDVLHIA